MRVLMWLVDYFIEFNERGYVWRSWKQMPRWWHDCDARLRFWLTRHDGRW